jgi:MGT family glycosyltransferase
MRVLQTLLAFSGSAPPQLAVTHQLVKRGHEVRVLAHRAARERVEGTGAEFVEFQRAHPDIDLAHPDSDPLRDWDARTKLGGNVRLLQNLLFAFIVDVNRECSAILDAWPADVTVCDWMMLGAVVAAEGAGVPAVALVHCPYPLPVHGVPPAFTGLKPMHGLRGSLRDAIATRILTRVLNFGLPALNKARREQDMQPLREWGRQLLDSEAIFVLTAPELDFSSRGRLPANVHYVGPAFEPYAHEWVSPWPQANTDPLVVIAFSTTYMNQRASVQRVLDAVAGLPVRALLTAGPALDPDTLRLPANAQAVAFVPHRAVFPHAALVVTHAGWQTVNAALADGVPLVCMPAGRDQPDNAARVVFAGAGVKVSERISSKRLRRVIAQALDDPELKRGASEMARALARSDGALAVVEWLEQLPA